NSDLRGLALESVFQADFHVVTQVGAALPAGAALAPAGHAEDAFEDVREGRAEIGAEAVAAAHALLKSGVTEPVVGGALVAVLQDVIGFVQFLEAVLARAVAWIAVGVVLHRELAVRSLELGLAAGPCNAQNFVAVAFRHAFIPAEYSKTSP